jgi:hypothetical protein
MACFSKNMAVSSQASQNVAVVSLTVFNRLSLRFFRFLKRPPNGATNRAIQGQEPRERTDLGVAESAERRHRFEPFSL